MAAGPSPHNVLLLQISDGLSREDLDSLLFCCSDVVPESKKVRRGTDLFTALKRRGLLSPGQYSYLREILAAIGRVDLSRKLPSELESVLAQMEAHNSMALVRNGQQSGLLTHFQEVSIQQDLTIAHKAQFLCIAERLTSEDVLKLEYLCFSQSCEELRETSAVSFLHRLEKAGIIDPCRPETLARLLQCIERRDLMSLLYSMNNPQFSQSFSLDQLHQLQNLKVSMFASKRSCYLFQQKVMDTIASSDEKTMEEHIVKPMMAKLVGSYDFSAIHQVCVGSLDAFQKASNFDSSIQTCLSAVSDFIEAYISLFYQYINCSIGIHSLLTLFQECCDCYNKFEMQVSQFQWNSTLREDVKRDLAQRRTAFGSPAYNAMNCIYDICSELTGSAKIELIMKEVDKNLYTLESLFYAFSFATVISHWLKSVLCLLAKNDTSAKSSISYNRDILQKKLVEIVRKYQDQISCCYDGLATILGEDVMQQMSVELLKESIDIKSSCLLHSLLSESDVGMFVINVNTLIFMDTMALLQLSYFGGEAVDFRGVLSRMHRFHVSFIASKYYSPCSMKLYQNLIRAYEEQLNSFRDQVLLSDPLCAPVLAQLIPSTLHLD